MKEPNYNPWITNENEKPSPTDLTFLVILKRWIIKGIHQAITSRNGKMCETAILGSSKTSSRSGEEAGVGANLAVAGVACAGTGRGLPRGATSDGLARQASVSVLAARSDLWLGSDATQPLGDRDTPAAAVRPVLLLLPVAARATPTAGGSCCCGSRQDYHAITELEIECQGERDLHQQGEMCDQSLVAQNSTAAAHIGMNCQLLG